MSPAVELDYCFKSCCLLGDLELLCRVALIFSGLRSEVRTLARFPTTMFLCSGFCTLCLAVDNDDSVF